MSDNAGVDASASESTQEAVRIYLDTSRLDLLARVRRSNADRYSRFRDVWLAANCELVVTRPHLLELRRHENAEVRERRYALFEDLTPVISDLARGDGIEGGPTLVLDREIVRAYVLTGRVSSTTEAGQAQLFAWCSIFPWRFETAEAAGQLRVMEDDVFWLVRKPNRHCRTLSS
jgi:hypothetical protein